MIFLIILTSVLALAALVLLVYVFILARPRAKATENENLLCDYAHRGLHDASVPENSLLAFQLACDKGVGIELDVQLSNDGEVMVFHDYTLKRMTGVDKKLSELDAEELCALKLKETEQKIPTFGQVLELVGGKVPLLIELKGESFDTSLCSKVADVLKEYKGEYCIESFNPLLLKEIRKYLPSAYCGLLYTNACRDKKKTSAINLAITAMALNFLARPDFIAYNKVDRNAFTVKLTTKFYRAEPFVWTVKGKEEFELAHKLGEHPIFEAL